MPQRRSDEENRARILARRRELKETGEGWTRFDILEATRQTVFFNRGSVGQATEGWKCSICGHCIARRANAHVDHIKPVSKYPQLAMPRSNLQILCPTCHAHKSDYDGEDWKKVTRRRRRGQATTTKGRARKKFSSD
jgi:5-methylcytosine-specific restriction endonuclease McrA